MPLKRIIYSQAQQDNLIDLTKVQTHKPHHNNTTVVNHLLQQGEENAFVYLQRYKRNQTLNIVEQNSLYSILHNLQKELSLPKLPNRIECYDISHLSGKYVYGSCINFYEGRPDKKHYKLFKCKDQNNDFDNHAEVLRRRLKHYDQEGWPNPDLIIVDGGKGQLSVDYAVLQELGHNIPIISIAKREEEIFTIAHFDGLVGDGREGGIILTAQAGFLVQRIRDEAHRFAITNNRQARLKSINKTSLDDIVGIGPKTIEKLMITYGSINAIIKNIQDNPTLMIKLIGQGSYETLKQHFTTDKE
jgi:excinuclease ABC subunit C